MFFFSTTGEGQQAAAVQQYLPWQSRTPLGDMCHSDELTAASGQEFALLVRSLQSETANGSRYMIYSIKIWVLDLLPILPLQV